MTDTTTADVLDLIDAAVEDWEAGPDAVRYNAPAGSKSRHGSSIALRIEQAPFVTGGAEIPAASFEMAAQYVRDFSEQMQRFVVPAVAALGETMKANWAAIGRLVTALGMPPCTVGEPCACYPKPFPAARDYRRRTKHRNRRRKR